MLNRHTSVTLCRRKPVVGHFVLQLFLVSDPAFTSRKVSHLYMFHYHTPAVCLFFIKFIVIGSLPSRLCVCVEGAAKKTDRERWLRISE